MHVCGTHHGHEVNTKARRVLFACVALCARVNQSDDEDTRSQTFTAQYSTAAAALALSIGLDPADEVACRGGCDGDKEPSLRS